MRSNLPLGIAWSPQCPKVRVLLRLGAMWAAIACDSGGLWKPPAWDQRRKPALTSLSGRCIRKRIGRSGHWLVLSPRGTMQGDEAETGHGIFVAAAGKTHWINHSLAGERSPPNAAVPGNPPRELELELELPLSSTTGSFLMDAR
jgi:hypothetical protein